MRISARLDLVFRDGDDTELHDVAARAVRQNGNVRWRTGDDGSRELHVRFPIQDDVNVEWLGDIADRYLRPSRR